MRPSLAFLGLVFVLGCSRESLPDSPDAGASAAPTTTIGNIAIGALRREFGATFDGLAFDRIAPAEAKLNRVEGAITPSFDDRRQVFAQVRLPERADQPFHLASGDYAIDVHVAGVRPVAARIDGGSVVYEGAVADATMFHVPTETGTEEYVRYAKRPETRGLDYAIDLHGIAGLRLTNNVLELLDPTGNPVLRTKAPTVFDAKGAAREGTITVKGCAVDTSDVVPWGRPVTPPGASTCIVETRFDDEGLAYPILVDPPWTTTNALTTKRYGHTATVLTGAAPVPVACTKGCVLAAGGRIPGTTTLLSSAELLNVGTGTWASAGSFTTARTDHVQVSYGSWGAIVAGGATSTASPPTATATAYRYTVGGSWTASGSMTTSRSQAAAINVGGSAIVCGGFPTAGTTALKTCDRWKPSAPTTWSAWNTMSNARARFVMAGGWSSGGTLAYDVILAAGGVGTEPGSALSAIEVSQVDGIGGWGFSLNPMSTGRQRFAAVYLSPYVYLFGSGATIDRYNVTTNASAKWNVSGTDVLLNSRTELAGALLTSGTTKRILAFGGGSSSLFSDATALTEMIDPVANNVTTVNNLNHPRRSHVGVTLSDGRVMAIGGIICTSFPSSGCSAPAHEEIYALGDNGATCTVAAECASGNCVDGVCCDTGCTEQCKACNLAGKVGTCSFVTGTPVTGTSAARTACPVPNTGTCGYACNGASPTCVAPGVGVTCGASTCSGGVETATSYCDAAGSCKTGATKNCLPYSCNAAGTACNAAPCSDNTQCATGYKCDSGSKTCVPTGDAGSPCSIATDCNSGLSCVDGVCCTSASCTSPMKCNIAPSAGSCKLPYGSTCSAATAASCPTGHCVDGVCCDTTCTGQCEQCNLAGYVGTCKPVPAGGSPTGGRTACTGTGACAAKCDGSSRVTCGPFPGATVTCATATCSAGVATPARYCNGAGACSATPPVSCGAYKCDATACKTSCLSNTDCATGYFCSGGVCTTAGDPGTDCSSGSECKSGYCVDGACCTTSSCTAPATCSATTDGTCAKPLGTACGASAECGSKTCVDGVCCDKACTGQCEACNVGGSVGTCVAVSGPPKGSRPACGGTGACKAQCNGSDRDTCGAYPGTSTVCSPAMCPSGSSELTPTAYCDGTGSCAMPSKSSCAPYTCSGGSDCKKLCTTSTDCAAGYGCKDGVCVTTGELGTICTDPTQCKSGKCVAGPGGKNVCCSVDSCPSGTTCAGVDSGALAGTCVTPLGGSCSKKEDCASGFCVDGVCCDKACDGQCEACDVSGSPGTCTPVKGPPHGMRTACFDGAGSVCASLSCDGTDRLKCVAFVNGPEKECEVKCTGTSETRARCDGKGTCSPGSPRDCAPYGCEDGKGCRTGCTTTADCASSFICLDGKCAPPSAKCDGDTKSVPADGSGAKDCAPYKCDPSTGNCYGSCTTSDQCAPGDICDGSKCAPAPAGDTGDSGGCVFSETRGGPATPIALLAALAFSLGARRRRRAR